MSEIKHSFTGGKMNKDLDERLVKNGEYRDAMNIQVRNTDGDAVGCVQNIPGNIKIGWPYSGVHEDWMLDNEPVCIGSIANEKTNKAYFLFHGGAPPVFQGSTQWTDITSKRTFIDTIIEQSADGWSKPVVVDKWCVINTAQETVGDLNFNSANSNGYTELQVVDGSRYRVGMTVQVKSQTFSAVDLFKQDYVDSEGVTQKSESPVIKAINGNTLLFKQPITGLTGNNSLSDASHFVFTHKRVLNFQTSNYKKITGINVIDNLLFWTDNHGEPKKINIDRCKEGTLSKSTHTKLCVEDPQLPGSLEEITSVDDNVGTLPINSDLREEHITVIRKSPRTAPSIHMKSTQREGLTELDIFNTPLVDNMNNINLELGEETIMVDIAFAQTAFRQDDIIILEEISDTGGTIGGASIVKFNFIGYLDDENIVIGEATDKVKLKMLAIVSENGVLLQSQQSWRIYIEKRKPLFELKLVKFGYRYRYEDGEYSSFSPWSRIAFLPDTFDYSPKQAYNLGMVNTCRELIIKDFIPYNKPEDVTAIDILYKATDSPNVFVANTIERGKDSEWEFFTPDPDAITNESTNELTSSGEILQGQLSITSEMIHRVLPETQLLRGWDNVPRRALTQEIVGNRVVYGNYTQGYNIKTPVGLRQSVVSNDSASTANPKPSIKSIRDYRVGMVFGDVYGRETPVITSSYSLDIGNNEYESFTGDVTVDKILCAQQNSFLLSQSWGSIDSPGDPPDWILDGGYVKYYVKETSNEYYNLVMSKYYDAGDGTVWLSFNSADRNKVDEETYLLLKNKALGDEPVLEKARYKIIAIANEAPDFIKTKKVNLGRVAIDATNTEDIWTGISESSDGDGPPSGLWSDDLSIKVDGGDWNNSGIGSNNTSAATVFGRELKGKVEMQLEGQFSNSFHYSAWRDLSNFSLTDVDSNGNGADVALTWTTKFGTDETGSNTYEVFNCASVDCATIQHSLLFRESVVENKPEFDGKFFVKVIKDLAFTSTAGLQNLEPKYVQSINYIESVVQNPAINYMDASIASTATFDETNSDADNWFGNAISGIVNLQDGSTLEDSFFEEVTFNSDIYDSPLLIPPTLYEYNNAGAIDGTIWNELDNVQATNLSKYNFFRGFRFPRYLKENPTIFADVFNSNGEFQNWEAYQYNINAQSYLDGVLPDYSSTEMWQFFTPGTLAPLVHYNERIKNFWKFYRNTSNGGTGVFIDGAAAYSYDKDSGNAVGFDEDASATDSIVYGEDLYTGSTKYFGYKPASIFKGLNTFNDVTGGSGDTLGALQISKLNGSMYVGTSSNANLTEDKDEMWDRFTTIGAVFSFNDDPNSHKYQIVSISEINQAVGNFTNISAENELTYNFVPFTNNYKPVDPSSIAGYGYRTTCYIEIRRLNSNNQPTTLGLPCTASEVETDEFAAVSQFDPRAFAKHDGSTSIKVTFWEPSPDRSGFSESTGSELGACWETEPKENVSLDLYHEASHAIPMRLGKDNAIDFAPLGSEIIISRDTGTTVSNVPLMDETADTLGVSADIYGSFLTTSNHRVGNLYFLNNSVIVSIIFDHVSLDELSVPYQLLKNHVQLGDNIVFKHNDGTLTQSKITRFVKPVDSDMFGSDQTINSQEEASGIHNKPRAFDDSISDPIQILFSSGVIDGWEDGDGTEFLISKDEITSTSASNIVGQPVHNIFQSVGEVDVDFTPSNVIVSSVADWPLDTNNYYVVTFDNFGDYVTSEEGYYSVCWDGISQDETNNLDMCLGCCPEIFDYDNAGVPKAVFLPTTNQTNLFFRIKVGSRSGYYEIDRDVYKYPVQLGWHNCWSFGNGVESDRVRDDFNAPQLDNGFRVSTTLTGYNEENISSGMIYSGLYNSTSQVNDLNEFNMSQKITKELNPRHGSIQRLKTRDTDTIVLTEDKIFRLLANKDALFNADGNPQLTASDRVLGTAIPYAGDYGISNNPESLAWDQYRMYFTDKQRGAVLRLSKDGLTPISNVGMKTYFRKNLTRNNPLSCIGSFDDISGEYNLTMNFSDSTKSTTVSFNESSKGWVSFRSFLQQSGLSVSGKYLTANKGSIWEHHALSYNEDGSCDDENDNCIERNRFYNESEDTITDSSITVVFNDVPGSVKSFKAINYEGSQAKVVKHTDVDNSSNTSSTVDATNFTISSLSDGEYYNLNEKKGWWVPDMYTDLQEGQVAEFKNKEGKWFNRITGVTTSITNLDTSEFTVQGLGTVDSITGDYVAPGTPTDIVACMDDGFLADSPYTGLAATNYNSDATVNDFSVCTYDYVGCTDVLASNYDDTAIFPCTDSCCEYDEENITDDDGTIFIEGCTDVTALNYASWATEDESCDDCCLYAEDNITDGTDDTDDTDDADDTDDTDDADDTDDTDDTDDDDTTGTDDVDDDIFGCMDTTASNYNPDATVDDGSCEEEVVPIIIPTNLWVQNWPVDTNETTNANTESSDESQPGYYED